MFLKTPETGMPLQPRLYSLLNTCTVILVSTKATKHAFPSTAVLPATHLVILMVDFAQVLLARPLGNLKCLAGMRHVTEFPAQPIDEVKSDIVSNSPSKCVAQIAVAFLGNMKGGS